MAKFRKKPVVIEAVQWFKNGDHPADYAEDRPGWHRDEATGELLFIVITGAYAKAHEWEGQVVRYFRRPDIDGQSACRNCTTSVVWMHDHGWIDTKEGGHIVCPGDWIITGIQGERYPCKPDIFAATYEREDR